MATQTFSHMYALENYVTGRWITGEGEGQVLYNAVNGNPIATASTQGVDFEAVLQYARQVGNPALRRMSFYERGLMLKALALYLRQHLDELYALSYQTGATRADSWVDIEGGIGNLFSYASLRRHFGNQAHAVDGSYHPLGKEGSFGGMHLLVPKEGVAIHINAFNFPVWGMLEKIAVNLLAGMPAVVKPATVTSFLTEAVVKRIIESNILPQGALQLVCGSAGNMLDFVSYQDVITFTGSASTGLKLKSHPRVLAEAVPFNMEADSLNCIVLAPDVEPGMVEWDLFIKEVRKEMTLKAGQRCTGVRRIFVPGQKMEAVQQALSQALAATVIGNPLHPQVRMGALAGQAQKREVLEQVHKLLASSQLVYGSLDSVQLTDADAQLGAFLSPLLLLNERPLQSAEVHEVEAFGPVSTLMPYQHFDEAIQLSKMGKGSLVSSIVTASPAYARQYVLEAGTHHGRILVLNAECGKENTGHGSPLPMLVHGGPGRAGGGEEMGGIRGVHHYTQRVAIQGSPTMLSAVSGQHQPGGRGVVDAAGIHPFCKHFEELQVGEQLVTAQRLITAEDINRFALLSGDQFYAHLQDTDFTDTMFERQVAHGYFILSAAAGLFVHSHQKNPVLLNYGIDEFRFTKPVYPGASIYVRLTCREKIPQEKREETDIPRGIVKWLVEVFDDGHEIVGLGTILTMVRRMP
ncbi:MAG TPA: phenylacetic acid degradation bifunctional protein PaaZ [Phnomibacter sp.]|nr:phenylacetic acid degradation bifunctional protein PaaZ [Phnomibacter sp.]